MASADAGTKGFLADPAKEVSGGRPSAKLAP
jgi:hypothetical protein